MSCHGATPLFSIRAVSLVSSHHCHGVEADSQCKMGLKGLFTPSESGS